MKKYIAIVMFMVIFGSCNQDKKSQDNEVSIISESNYLQNRSPLKPRPYLELPLGSIKPQGWLLDQLERMKNGMTGHLDEIYPEVVGKRNGWLGGDGDGWERGPYWIDGLLPLAFILDDTELKAKTQPWIEWTINNQTQDGYLGPVPFDKEPEHEAGLQRGKRKDWWPKMVMLKILKQYYDATGDERVLQTLTNYFKYQLKELPNRPLDYLSLWGNRRGGDNLQVVYWLYNITGDEFLLELGEIIQEQTFPWTTVFLNEENNTDPIDPWHYQKMKRYPFDKDEINSLRVSKIGGIHTVNFAQGLKQPIVYYQKEPEEKYISAVKKALSDIKKYHGQPQGMYGGDEPLHGKDPTKGVEFCSISEEMFSLETIIKITGDMEFADLLEKITYNALPTQASDDYSNRQYFQAANQVELTDELQTSFETGPHAGTDFVFGILSGYPCCTTNMHQSWPKFVQNLFYATHDNGVAALQYAPSVVQMKVAEGIDLTIQETTGFPFKETVNFKFELASDVQFPFHLRIPTWTDNPTITVNGEQIQAPIENNIAILNREWKNGDKISLTMPMKITTTKWYEFSSVIERGPLVYSLKVRGEQKKKNRDDHYGEFTEVFAKDDWNYGLIKEELENIPESVQIIENDWDESYPWNLDNAPIELRIKGVQLPQWKSVNGNPVFPGFWGSYYKKDGYQDNPKVSTITLVPYGCTTLRITEFPVYDIPESIQ